MKVVNKIHIESASFFRAISWLGHIAGFRNFGHSFFRASSFPDRPIQTRSSFFACPNSNTRFAWFWAFTPLAPFTPCCNLVKIGCSSKDLKLKSVTNQIKLQSRIFWRFEFFISKRMKKSQDSGYRWYWNTYLKTLGSGFILLRCLWRMSKMIGSRFRSVTQKT